MKPRPIRFLKGDREVAVDGVPITTTVLEWLRATGCTGTKEGCAEGDCGACTVVVAELERPGEGQDAEGQTTARAATPAARSGVVDGLRLRPVNACMRLVPTLDGKALFTVEDLRVLAGGALHPVQQAMVDAHGAQCGFCTPGFVMTLFQSYVRGRHAGTRPDRQALADDLAGNLCRCTGYRPILEAGQRMFDAPAVLPDLAALTRRLSDLQAALRAHDGADGFAYAAPDPARPGRVDRFEAPRSLDRFAERRAADPAARLLAGTTDIGVWLNKQFRDVGDLLYVGEVAQLAQATVDAAGGLSIGAAVSLEDGWSVLVDTHPELRELWLRFASPPIRHAGTLVGNLANGSPIGDGAPALIALGATLRLRAGRAVRRLPLQAFYLDYMRNALAPGEFIEAVEVPPRPADMLLRAYKVAKRFDSDISAVCGAFVLTLDRHEARDAQDGRDRQDAAGPRVTSARLAFGGMAAVVRRASAAEQALVGQPWSAATVRAAMGALSGDFTPLTDLRASAAYRQRVAANLLWRLWLETGGATPLAPDRTRVWADVIGDVSAPGRASPAVAASDAAVVAASRVARAGGGSPEAA